MTKSIYKSDKGRDTMAAWYERHLEKLGCENLESIEVDTRYGRTNILVGGPVDAPPLWCFHGAMSTAPAALTQVPSLLERFRIYFPDTIGQPGRSDERRLDWQEEEHGHWVVDILDALEITSIRALGVSLGGYVVLRAASIAPERIERAVLWVPGGIVKPSKRGMFGLIFAALVYSMMPTPERLARILERTTTDLDDEFVEFFGDSLKYVHPDRRFPNTLADDALAAWTAPVMLITHQGDTVFPPEPLLERAQSLVPNLVQTRAVEGWKHMPPFDQERTAPVLAEVCAFLTS